jgi:Tol biopolymer transport system component
LLLQERYSEDNSHISSDGRWLAYVSNESGTNEVYVRPFPDIDKGKWPVSTDSGDSPLWSPEGRQLFYRSGDSFMSVEIDTESAFSLGKPTVLFKGIYASYPGMSQYALW